MQPPSCVRPYKMSIQTYLIDTNVIIGLEDHHTVQPAFAALLSIASKHKVGVLGHEASRDDIQRDRNTDRRKISLSKLEKFQLLKKVRGLEVAELERKYGPFPRPNDIEARSEEHTSELQSQSNLVCRLLLEKKN